MIITICGIFRDTFGTHIDLINRITEKIASLDEPEEKNFVKRTKTGKINNIELNNEVKKLFE